MYNRLTIIYFAIVHCGVSNKAERKYNILSEKAQTKDLFHIPNQTHENSSP